MFPPPEAVIAAFGGSSRPLPLEGGRGNAWRVGDLVLRPIDDGEPPLDWQLDVLASITGGGFRVALPQTTLAGEFACDGWCAWHFVAGRHEERRWPEIITVGELFHRALAELPAPGFVGRRTDPWAIGDCVAWGDVSADPFIHIKHIPSLVATCRPVDAPSQLIHGDLTGNVLFAAELPPAIIDFSPYWRPTAYASAIVVADALVWEGADETLLGAVAHVEDFPQFLVRALIMRIVVDRLFREGEPTRPDRDDPFLPVVQVAIRLAES